MKNKILKYTNIALNVIIIFLILYSLFLFIYSNIKNLKYNSEYVVQQDVLNYEEVYDVQLAIRTYLALYAGNYYDAVNTSITMLNRKNSNVYSKISEYVNENFNSEIILDNVRSEEENIYSVEYYINIEKAAKKEDLNRIIIKLNTNNFTYTILYDSLLDKYGGSNDV